LLVPGSAADVMSVTVLLQIGALGDGTLGTAICFEVVATHMAFVVIISIVLAVVIVFLAGTGASMVQKSHYYVRFLACKVVALILR